MPVTGVEVEERAPLAGGRAFGESGPYEYLSGVLRFASDPAHPGNAVICDLARVRAAAETLVRDRYLLADDIEPVVAVAGRKWDAFRGS